MKGKTWNDPPHAGERWRGPGPKGIGTQTRVVVDRTLGGDVIFRAGRVGEKYDRQVSHDEWTAWQTRARRAPRPERG